MKKLVICAIIMTLSAHCSAAYNDCQLAQDKLVDEYNKKFWLVDKIPTALGTMLGWAIGTLAVFRFRQKFLLLPQLRWLQPLPAGF